MDAFFYFRKMGNKNKNKIFEQIEVIDAGAKGKAVAKAPDGKVVFLDLAVPGDVVTVETFKQRNGYYEAKILHFEKLSDKRTTPICEHFDWCGGCKWQNMAYEHQLYFKEKEVLQNLKRIGHLEWQDNLPVLGCDEPYFYRNKMEYAFAERRWFTPKEIQSGKEISESPACGFHIAGMWDKVLDIEKCYLQAEPSNTIRNFIKQYAVDHQISFFNPRNKTGFLRTLMVRIATTNEIMVLVQFFYKDNALIKKLLNAVSEQFPQITSLLYAVNPKDNDSIYDLKIEVFKGRDHIIEKLEDLQFKINAKSFFQTNTVQALKLYNVVKSFCNLTGSELIYDLYTGTGTIAQFLAKNAKKIIGIESVPEAITDAVANAKLNQIKNVEFLVGDMKTVFNDDFLQQNGHPDLIVTDPPRDGMHVKVVEQILKIAPEKIVYVSCNAATQARDLALMKEYYNLIKIQPVDMFPQTHHIENVVLLQKKIN